MSNKKRLVGVVLAAIMVISVFTAIVTTGDEIQSVTSVSTTSLPSSGEAIPGEVIVGFKEAMTMGAEQNVLVGKYSGAILDRNPALNCVLVKVDDSQEFITTISKDAFVKYAEPNYIVKALYTPNDYYYSLQWGLPTIKADLAWDTEKGDYDNVKIAIVDTGIDYNHEDLGNYVSGGYDWINMDNDPWDDEGHGTHCAGIAAAVMDNVIGVAGIAQVKVMAEKVLNETGFGSVWNVSQGIRHAADNDADVISLSLGDYSYSSTLENACQYAWDAGCVLTGAAGNDNQYGICYPAKFDTVICVGAINQDNQRCDYPSWGSNWGPEIELVAPGNWTASTYPAPYYYIYASGTSMATPHVAGVAALVWSNCLELTNQEVRDQLADTADDLGTTGWDQYYGYGRVDAEEAIECGIEHPDIKIDPTSFDVTLPPDTIYSTNLTVGNDGNATLTYDLSDIETTGGLGESSIEGTTSETSENSTVIERSLISELEPSKAIIFQAPIVAAALNELIYDDGSAEDAYAWSVANNRFAVRFTPSSYPAVLKTARFCFWENWPDSDHEEFTVEVYDDDGPGSAPGTLLGTVNTTATDWGWHDVNLSGLGIILTSGDFYIAEHQLAASPDCEGLCVDKEVPHYGRSWDWYSGSWSPWSSENYMIRCVVEIMEDCLWLEENPKSGDVEPSNYDWITVSINTTGLAPGEYCAEIWIANNDPDENPKIVPVNLTVYEPEPFDTHLPKNPYPSIFGTHNGTITPNQTINVSKMFTYSCSGTGGHSESVAFFNATTEIEIANGTWNGYQGASDYHCIEFDVPFTLHENETYNYTIRTGSYPQIHHTPALPTENGWINCTGFTDANGKEYTDWIPAIKLE